MEHRNGTEASTPEALRPVVQAPNLPGYVRVEEADEGAQRCGVRGPKQHVVVVGEKSEREEVDPGPEMHGAPEDAQDEVIEVRMGPKEIPPLKGAGRDLDQAVVRHES